MSINNKRTINETNIKNNKKHKHSEIEINEDIEVTNDIDLSKIKIYICNTKVEYEKCYYIINNIHNISYDNNGICIQSLNIINGDKIYHNKNYYFDKFRNGVFKIRQIFNRMKKENTQYFISQIDISSYDPFPILTNYHSYLFENECDIDINPELCKIQDINIKCPTNRYYLTSQIKGVNIILDTGFKKISNYELKNNKVNEQFVKHFLKCLYLYFWTNPNPYAICNLYENVNIFGSYLILDVNFSMLQKIPLNNSKYANYLIFNDLYDFYKILNNYNQEEFTYYNIIEIKNINSQIIDYNYFGSFEENNSKLFSDPEYDNIHEKIKNIVSESLASIKLFDLLKN